MNKADEMPGADAIAQIADWLAEAGLDSIEIVSPDGDRLRIGVGGGSAQGDIATQSPAKAEETQDTVLVESPYFGRFAPIDWPHGAPVAKGALLGMLELDMISLPILAPCDGHVAETLAKPSSLVGYGESVFRLVPKH